MGNIISKCLIKTYVTEQPLFKYIFINTLNVFFLNINNSYIKQNCSTCKCITGFLTLHRIKDMILSILSYNYFHSKKDRKF